MEKKTGNRNIKRDKKGKVGRMMIKMRIRVRKGEILRTRRKKEWEKTRGKRKKNKGNK